jgi:hypothetical protein
VCTALTAFLFVSGGLAYAMAVPDVVEGVDQLAGTSGGLGLSGVLTLLLLPIAALAVLKGTPASINFARAH